MKRTGRRSSVAFCDVRSSIENYSTKFSSPKFVKRVEALTDEQRIAVEKTGFGNLLLVPNQTMNRKLLLELMDKWSSERRAFVLRPGELPVSLLDVALIMGLRVTGNPVLLKDDEPFSELEMQFGASPEKRRISVDSIESKLESLGGIVSDDFVRTFLLFVFGVFLFPDTSGNIDSRYLSYLINLDDVCEYAWGSAVLSEIIMWLNKRKDSYTQSVGGCLTFLQIWSYEHIDLARPGVVFNTAFPRACRWENRKYTRPKPIATMFDELENEQIIWTLEPTPHELDLSIVRELMEVHNKGNALPRGQELSLISPMVVKSEIIPDSDTENDTSRAEEKELLQPRPCELQTRLDPSRSIMPVMAQHVVKSEIVSDSDTENDTPRPEEENELLRPWPFELQNRPDPSAVLEYSAVPSLGDDRVEPPSTSGDSSMELPADNEDNLITKNLKLEERISELEKQIDSLRLELKDRQVSGQKLNEKNAELKKEVDDLRRENRGRDLTSADLFCRLDKVLSGDII